MPLLEGVFARAIPPCPPFCRHCQLPIAGGQSMQTAPIALHSSSTQLNPFFKQIAIAKLAALPPSLPVASRRRHFALCMSPHAKTGRE